MGAAGHAKVMPCPTKSGATAHTVCIQLPSQNRGEGSRLGIGFPLFTVLILTTLLGKSIGLQ